MNKEEFKLTLIRQLKDNDTVFRAVMYKEKMDAANDKTQFDDFRRFIAGRFGLGILVEKIHNDDNEECFQIQFKDLESYKLYEYSDIDLCKNPKSRIVYVETMRFSGTEIEFFIKRIVMKTDLFGFRIISEDEIHKVKYDIYNDAMSIGGSLSSLFGSWIALKKHAVRDNTFYVDYLFNEETEFNLRYILLNQKLTSGQLLRISEVLDKRGDIQSLFESNLGHIACMIRPEWPK